MKLADREINIMLIDDDKDDLQLMVDVINEYKINIDITIVSDGEEALELLQRQLVDKKLGKLPNLIFLDLNMPRKNGFEFIGDIKRIEKLNTIPIIVFSSSHSQTDIEESYRLGASCYLGKPMGYKEFQSLIKVVNDFWFTVVEYVE